MESWIDWMVVGLLATLVFTVAGVALLGLGSRKPKLTILGFEPVSFAGASFILALLSLASFGIGAAYVHDHGEYTEWRDACTSQAGRVQKLSEGSSYIATNKTFVVTTTNTYGCIDPKGKLTSTHESDTD